MSIKMRDLIRAVRACKTAAEERAVISKECALIRTAIKEEDEQFRYRNVAKLMYIHMLGYPTHFGQMECLKLISAPSFPEKRIGYLALTLLLNEQAEVLTLVTNSLKLDLVNNNQYIQGLALITIGNLATQDMARDLISDVDKLLKSNNSYLRKKAALAAIRLLKKEPDLIDSIADRIISLLKDRAHGVLHTGVQLMIDVIDLLPDMKVEYSKLVPSLVRLLRNFISMGFSPEHDVSGITDPFMQVKILRILRILGKNNDEASEQMNDVLAQVATNTETSKNAGNAILYECVQTIMEIKSESSLRVLAVNILGRFLLNRDNNIRYVALNSLSKVVNEDISAVQRHRTTIVECLKDADISIRQRALELIFQLVNDSNVIALTTELLNYLIIAQVEQKATLSSKIMQIVEKYSPNKKWRVDTIITMLSIASNQADESVIRTSILFIAQSDGFQGYATHRLYRAMLEDTSQIGMVHVGIWCIGEFGDLLTREVSLTDSDGSLSTYPPVIIAEILNLLEKCMKLHNSDNVTKSFILNALIKLTIRFPANAKSVITDLILPFQTSISLELQQRSVEYIKLLTSDWDNIRKDLFGKMPIIDEANLRKRRAAYDLMSPIASSNTDQTPNGINSPGGFTLGVAGSSHANANASSLLDLDDIFGGSSVSTSQSNVNVSSNNTSSNANDLLNDIFSLNSTPSTSYPTNNVTQSSNDIFGLISQSPLPVPVNQTAGLSNSFAGLNVGLAAPNPVVTAFDKNGLFIVLELSKPNPSTPNLTRILTKFSNNNPYTIEGMSFQAAVPKYLKLEMLPASSTTIPAGSNAAVTQEIKVTNTMQGEKNIMLKLKINYKVNGSPIEELVQVSSFPALY